MRKVRRFALTLALAPLGGLLLAPGAQARVHLGRASALPAGLSVKPGAVSIPKGARRLPRTRSAPKPAVAAPRAAASRVVTSAAAAAATGTVRHNWDGVSSLDSAVTNFQQEFEPPDQGLCVGNGFVMEMVNSAYTIYRTNGTKVAGPFNVNGPFDEGLAEFTSDPRCHYDPATNTWFASIVFISGGGVGDKSHIDIAVNPSGDPTTLWKNYQIDTTDSGAPKSFDCPCFGDQPRLGIDSQNLYITSDEFSILGPEFNGAQIFAIAKKDLVNEVDAPHYVLFDRLSIGGAPTLAPQPAITNGSSPAEFFLNALDPFGTFDNRIGVWSMTNRGNVALGKAPTLKSRVIASEPYGNPPPAEQKGAGSLIDSGDDRMQQAQYINGHVYGELGTTLNVTGDSEPRAAAAWFEVNAPTGALTSVTKVTRQGYVAVKGNHVMYPALQTTPSRAAVMGMSITGPNRFPSTAYAELAPGASNFGPVTITGPGVTNYDPDATRWGDYSWSILDPSGNSVWMADEYVPKASRQTVDRARNWGTRVFEVAP